MRKPAASHPTLMMSRTEARTSPGLSIRLVRRASHRCARYKTMPVMIARTRAAISVSQPVASPLAALSAAFSWVKTVFAAGSSTRWASSEATWRNEPPVSGKPEAYSACALATYSA